MSTDISAIMQLLQRQMALVPPAYSTVSSPPHPSPYPEPGERLVQPVTPLESEALASLSQVSAKTYTQHTRTSGIPRYQPDTVPIWASLSFVPGLAGTESVKVPYCARSLTVWIIKELKVL